MQTTPHGSTSDILGSHEDILRAQKPASMPAGESDSGGLRNLDSIMRIPLVVPGVPRAAVLPLAPPP